jgi:mitochondrial fission 1 protein
MGEATTRKESQKASKRHLDEMLQLACPSREVLEELAVACAKDSSPDNTFQYAFALSKSTEKSELRYSVTILDGLVAEGYGFEIDCMYAAATALYLLGDYEESRARCESILRSQPEQPVAIELHRASIESIEQRDAEKLKQAAIGGTAAVAVLGVLAGVASVITANR